MNKVQNIAIQFDYCFGENNGRCAQITVGTNTFDAKLVGEADGDQPAITHFSPDELIEIGRVVQAIQKFGIKRVSDQIEAQVAPSKAE